MDTNFLVAAVSISTALASFIIGLVVLSRNITSNLNFSFCIFAWLITGWEMMSYAFFLDQNNFTLYKFSITLGGACLLSITPWVQHIVKDRPNKYLPWIFIALAVVLTTVPIWDQGAMSNFENLGNSYVYDVSASFYLYVLVVFGSVVYSFYLLSRSLAQTTGQQRLFTLMILAALMIYVAGELLMGVVLPVLKQTPTVPYDNFGAVFFVAVSAYAIFKYSPKESISSIF